jgi:hypothetical protein
MSMLYRIQNATAVTTAAPVKQPTGSAIRTMLQVLHPNMPLTVVEWGISFDGSAAATPIEVELIHTTTIAATMSTALVANDITCLNEVADAGVTAGGLTLSTTGCSFATAAVTEGAVVAPVRYGDYQQIAPSNQYLKQFPLGQGFKVPAAGVLRIRVTAPVTVNAVMYVVVGVGGD